MLLHFAKNVAGEQHSLSGKVFLPKELGAGFNFFSLICLVSPTQSKKITKCPLIHQDGSLEITIGGRDITLTIILAVVTVDHLTDQM